MRKLNWKYVTRSGYFLKSFERLMYVQFTSCVRGVVGKYLFKVNNKEASAMS